MSDLNLIGNSLIKAANEASKVVKEYISSGFQIDMKGPANLVTEADIAAEKTIVSCIKKTFPDHNFLGEEQEKADVNSDNLWIIDPIDGTTNFAHSVPVVGISIAFSHKGQVLAGGVLNPFTDELYFALKNQGATLNDKKISVSYATEINQALVSTGFYYGLGPHLSSSLDIVKKLIELECHGIRRMGAASIDLCYVACGLFDAYFELKLNPWDYAAGMLIIREAGGKIVNMEGNDLELTDSKLLCCNPKLLEKIYPIIKGNLN